MSNVLYDVSKVLDMYNGKLSRQYIWGFNDYSKVYYSSNEDFKNIFSSVDMNDKSVLTVLASGDQAIHFYNKGAKRVDVFDVNKITKYYYGIRLLAIKYLGSSFLGDEVNFINNVIDILNKCSMDNDFEKEIVSFWSLLLKKIPKQDIFNTIFRGYDKYVDNEDLKIKFNDSINSSFYNFDISDNVDECNNKYDILVLSNIHEYVSLNNMSIFTDNVSKLLQDNGYALITNFGPIQKSIREGLERRFLIEDLPVEYYCGVPVGNKLIKRRS